MSWIGIDIGGANLKAADGQGWARSTAFAVWRYPQNLSQQLAELVGSAPTPGRLAVTMTAELCDCFDNKAAGVRHILDCVEAIDENRDALVYLVDGRFATTSEAREAPQLAAASNWHALASFAARFVTSRTGLMIDVGSTTTDLIPIIDGRVAARGSNDTERLLSRELLYRGVGRTPICALVDTLPLRGEQCPVAAEVFATTADAYVLSGELKEDEDVDWTANGRPLMKKFARQRLARQLCADADDLAPGDIEQLARAVREAHYNEISTCVRLVAKRLPELPGTCIVSGSGEFLARAVVEGALGGSRTVSLAAEIGLRASQCAPSHALAVLARECKKAGKNACFPPM
jgi:probable H4MPT-linked C1 transfer pathway protein